MMNRDKNEYVDDEIWVTHFTLESALHFRQQVRYAHMTDPAAPIIVHINSYGGEVPALAMMLETMEEIPASFVTIAQGAAISCGAILLSHGDVRFCGPFTKVMIHNVSSGTYGDALGVQADALEFLKVNEQFIGLLAENCKIDYEALQHLIKEAPGSKELWLDAQEALKLGIVDHIGLPRITMRAEPIFEMAELAPQKATKKKTSKTSASTPKKRKKK